jgi:hypothetical protein
LVRQPVQKTQVGVGAGAGAAILIPAGFSPAHPQTSKRGEDDDARKEIAIENQYWN